MHIVVLEGQALILQILMLLRLEHGFYINKMVKVNFRGTSRATIYRVMSRLETAGLVASGLRDVGGIGGIRREFHLTPAGEDVADHVLAIEESLKSAARDVRKHRQTDAGQ